MCASKLPFKNLNEILNKLTPALPNKYQEFNKLLNWFVFHLAKLFLWIFILFNSIKVFSKDY